MSDLDFLEVVAVEGFDMKGSPNPNFVSTSLANGISLIMFSLTKNSKILRTLMSLAVGQVWDSFTILSCCENFQLFTSSSSLMLTAVEALTNLFTSASPTTDSVKKPKRLVQETTSNFSSSASSTIIVADVRPNARNGKSISVMVPVTVGVCAVISYLALYSTPLPYASMYENISVPFLMNLIFWQSVDGQFDITNAYVLSSSISLSVKSSLKSAELLYSLQWPML